jgi:ubiquinone biosynthesis protein COQ9
LSTNQGGASNSFFFVTEDKQFIVKTISKQEKDVMLKLLEYIPDQNYENSLICFPVGMFEVKIEGF